MCFVYFLYPGIFTCVIMYLQVILLWNRALSDPGFRRIFCLVHAERLSYQVSDKALRALAEQSQACEGGECSFVTGAMYLLRMQNLVSQAIGW